MMLHKVRSKDGTQIAYEQVGEGPPLVAVPGVLTSSRRWPVLPALAEHFTVYAVDRRGRGDSGDGQQYAIEREFEDVAAVVDAIGTKVDLFGHSFGGTCVLGASLLTPNIRRLVVYEADSPQGLYHDAMPEHLMERFRTFVDAGQPTDAVKTFLQETFQMSEQELAEAQTWPTFPAMVDAAGTFPREIDALSSYQFETARFSRMTVPTLLLVGGDSPDFAKQSMDRWQEVLPNSRIVVLEGQEHMAHYHAPDLFVRELVTFLKDQACSAQRDPAAFIQSESG